MGTKLEHVLKDKATTIKWSLEKDRLSPGIFGTSALVDKQSRGIFTILTTGLKLTKEEQERQRKVKAGYDLPPLFLQKASNSEETLSKEGLVALFVEEPN